MKSGEKKENVKELQTVKNASEIVDYKVTMLIAAGANSSPRQLDIALSS